MSNEEPEKGALRSILDVVATIAVAIVAALLLRTFVIGVYVVPTGSMLDTIQEGDMLVGEKVTLHWDAPHVGDVVTSYSWADRELKAFRRVTLEPGGTATVVFDIPVCDCTIADADANRIVEPGEFELLIGHSSRRDDLKRTTFTVA